MTDTLTLRLSRNDARLVQLALGLLRAERRAAPQYAAQVSDESREHFLRDMAEDAEQATAISARIDDALVIRRRFNAAEFDRLALDVTTIPDTPTVEGLDVIDCTGVLLGNSDIVCERGAGGGE